MSEPRIWIGSLAAYNAGDLKGEWFTPTDYGDGDEFEAAVRKLLPEDEHEELYIGDVDDIPPKLFDEHDLDFDFMVEVCEFIEDKEDLAYVAVLRWQDINSNKPDVIDLVNLLDEIIGEYSSGENWEREYAYQYVENMGEVPSWLQNYIDYDAMGRDLTMDLSEYEYGGSIYVFQN